MEPIVVYPSLKAQYLAFAVAGVLIVGIVVVAMQQPDQKLYLLLIAPLLLDLWATVTLVAKRFIKMTVGDGKLRHERGGLSKTVRTLDLIKVQDVRADLSLAGRLLGVGDLTIETASENGRIVMESIDRPQVIAEQILALAHRRATEVGPRPPGGSSGV